MPLLIRVTEAIKAASLFDYGNLDPFYADRGTAFHKATEFEDKGTLREDSVDPENVDPLAGWRAFKRDARPEILGIEVQFQNDRLGFRGTADRRLKINGREGVLDIKRGKPAPWHRIQTAGYAIGLSGQIMNSLARWNFYPEEGGRYKLVEHTNPEDLSVFLSCLTIAKWKCRMGVDA